MKVVKRNGKKEPVMLDKILDRITQQTYGLDKLIIPFEVAQKVIEGIMPDIKTQVLDQLAMETAASLATKHPDYSILAARLAITNLHKETKKSFSETVTDLYKYIDPKTGKHSPIVSESFYSIVKRHADEIDSAIVHSRDHNFDYFGFKTLEKSYLLKLDGKVAERPQYMYMRTALQVWGENLEKVIETYNTLSEGYYTHATPTLFNSGTGRPQLSSCFLLDLESDSIEGIFNTLKESAQISKNAGGIGISFTKVRSKGTYIAGTNGTSNGIIPFLKIFNETARAVDQGGGKRKGSIAIYMEPWHSDIMEFLDLRKNQGKDEVRARDLFLAMWMNDLFMERVELDEDWTLMCPHECSGLTETYGQEFRDLYTKYENLGKGKRTLKAREVWNKILESQIETGTPYILYKDSINEKSNQANIGVVRSSNLCAEIVEATGITKTQGDILKNKELLTKLGLSEFYGEESVNETAVCNLASIALPKFINKNKTYNFNKLYEVAYAATINLNNVIDVNFYPSPAAKFSNLLHRPIGLGVQGLADVFFMLGLPYESEEAKSINKEIFETIYYASIKASCDLAKTDGAYATYEGSPISQGKLQFDLWGVTPTKRWDWDKLREDIKKYGVRNSLTTCIMPTASTASILGNEASCEAQTSNMYTRSVLSGTFILVNKYLVKELVKLNLWGDALRRKIITENGSVQNIPEVPTNLKEVFKTVYEIKQRDVIDMAADRGAFIDQTQSMNIFMDSPNFAKLTAMHFYGWGRRNFIMNADGTPNIPQGETIEIIYDKDGQPRCYRDKKSNLKTGIYYLRNKAASDAVKFTVQEEQKKSVEEQMAEISCSLDNPDDCLACGS
ncbi:MAG: ribonucleoside-diphosphate reductase subunit alpha [Crocinitomicaceae bacterium]|nr:ribonucleoside-diphosphate reductase subunit alpha [Crocinitomicaceae bacterium]